MSTRIVNMQCELRLHPLVERIYFNVTRLTVKCLHFPHLSPHYSQLIRMSLGPARPVPPILPAERALIRSVSFLMRSLDLDVPAVDVPPGLPPWLLPTPEVSLTPASFTATVGPGTRSNCDVLHHSTTLPLHRRVTAIGRCGWLL